MILLILIEVRGELTRRKRADGEELSVKVIRHSDELRNETLEHTVTLLRRVLHEYLIPDEEEAQALAAHFQRVTKVEELLHDTPHTVHLPALVNHLREEYQNFLQATGQY